MESGHLAFTICFCVFIVCCAIGTTLCTIFGPKTEEKVYDADEDQDEDE